MSTIQQLRANLQREINQLTRQAEADKAEVRAILDNASDHGHASLTMAEDTRAEALIRSARIAEAAVQRKRDALSQAAAIEAEDSAADTRMLETHETSAGKRSREAQANRTATVSITREERTYHAGNDPRGSGFLADVARAQVFGDAEAYGRLAQHMREERVERGYQERTAGDLVTGTSGAGAGGLVVPQYLTDLCAPAAAARRPLADAMTRHQLPSTGMTFVVPAITTPTAVGNQTTQLLGTGIGAQSMNVTDLTCTVYTAAGYQNVSRQAIDRSVVGDFVLSDLFARYATNLDSNLLNISTYGLSAKASSTLGAFADTQPTGAKLYPKILAASSGVEAVLLGENADLCRHAFAALRLAC